MEKVNYVAIQQGFPGCGKTQLLKEHTDRHLAAGAYAFIQDPDSQLADVLPVYPSVGHWAQAQVDLAAQGSLIERGAAIATMSEEELSRDVFALAPHLPQGAYAFIGYDEAVLLEGTSASWVSDHLKELLGRRRHMRIAAEILTQDLGQLHKLWQSLATDLFLFRTSDEDSLKKISKRFGTPMPVLQSEVSRLADRFEYLHLQPGRLL